MGPQRRRQARLEGDGPPRASRCGQARALPRGRRRRRRRAQQQRAASRRRGRGPVRPPQDAAQDQGGVRVPPQQEARLHEPLPLQRFSRALPRHPVRADPGGERVRHRLDHAKLHRAPEREHRRGSARLLQQGQRLRVDQRDVCSHLGRPEVRRRRMFAADGVPGLRQVRMHRRLRAVSRGVFVDAPHRHSALVQG